MTRVGKGLSKMANAGAGDIKAGGVWVEIFGKDAALVRALKGAKAKLTQFANSAEAIGRTMVKTAAMVLTQRSAH